MNSQFGIQLVPAGTGGGAYITIIDEKSGEKLLDLGMYAKDVGAFLLGKYVSRMGEVTNNLELIGLSRKTTDVPIPALKGMYGLTEAMVAEAAKPYEDHGWKVDAAHYIRAQKKTNGDGNPLVPFFRYVKE